MLDTHPTVAFPLPYSHHATSCRTAPHDYRTGCTCPVSLSTYGGPRSVDSARNRARDYALVWQPALVGDGTLIRTWGRTNSATQTRVDYYPDRAAAQAHVEEILRRGLHHGYHVLAWQ